MASVPGSHYDVFVTTGQTANFGVTSDPNSVRAAVSGEFNLEVVTNGNGTGSVATAPGYQGLAILAPDGRVLTAAHGDYGIVDNPGASDLITLGDGNVSVGGASGDTILGGTGASQFIDAHLGHQSVVGGNGGNQMIWGGAGDTIQGGSGGNETIGGVAGNIIIGGAGNEFIDGSRGGQSIVGGIGGNETIWGGTGDTILGGSAGNETIGGAAGDTILGGAANTFIDGGRGSQSIAGGSGNTTVWGGCGDTVQGASAGGTAMIAFGTGRGVGQGETLWDNGTTSGGNDTVVDFTQSIGDRISLNAASDSPNSVLASATQGSSGDAVVHLSDGSSMTILGVPLASLTTSYFTTH